MSGNRSPLSVLITGFGPFPGAPFNPSGELALRVAALRRPAFAGIHRAVHVFNVSYRAIDHDLPALLERHRPDAMLMFGLAARTPYLRIETRARNMIAAFPDRSGLRPIRGAIAPGLPARRLLAPHLRLLAAARATRQPIRLSRDAGAYLCNYLCWRAMEAAGSSGGPRLVAFVHVPKLPMTQRQPSLRTRQAGMRGLVMVGEALLRALVAEARRERRHETQRR